MIALSQFDLQLLCSLLVHLVMVIELVEVVDQLLVVLDGEVRLQLFHIFNLFFVAYQLLLHFADHFVAAFVALLYVSVPPVELLCLICHVLEQLLVHAEVAGSTLGVRDYLKVLGNWSQELGILSVFLGDLSEDLRI